VTNLGCVIELWDSSVSDVNDVMTQALAYRTLSIAFPFLRFFCSLSANCLQVACDVDTE
jgi:hypothetical protein